MCFTWADGKHECKDGHALIADDDWIMLCSPNEEIVSRSPSVLNKMPSLSPSKTVGEYTSVQIFWRLASYPFPFLEKYIRIYFNSIVQHVRTYLHNAMIKHESLIRATCFTIHLTALMVMNLCTSKFVL